MTEEIAQLRRSSWIETAAVNLGFMVLALVLIAMGTVPLLVKAALLAPLAVLLFVLRPMARKVPPEQLGWRRADLSRADERATVQLLQEVAARLGTTAPGEVLFTEKFTGLAAAGCVPRDQMLIDENSWRFLSPRQKATVLAHEMAHVMCGHLRIIWLWYGGLVTVPLVPFAFASSQWQSIAIAAILSAFSLAFYIAAHNIVGCRQEYTCDRIASLLTGLSCMEILLYVETIMKQEPDKRPISAAVLRLLPQSLPGLRAPTASTEFGRQLQRFWEMCRREHPFHSDRQSRVVSLLDPNRHALNAYDNWSKNP